MNPSIKTYTLSAIAGVSLLIALASVVVLVLAIYYLVNSYHPQYNPSSDVWSVYYIAIATGIVGACSLAVSLNQLTK